MIKSVYCTLLLLVISSYAKAQESIDIMRYEYQLTFYPDRGIEGKEDKEVIEKAFLDIYDGQSRFGTEGTIKRNEVLIEFDEGNNKGGDVQKRMEALREFRSVLQWVVYKGDKELHTYETLVFDSYKIVEPFQSVKWNILEEVDEYEGMKVQKAIGKLGGREWTVWFTQDIPLMEGPYKFKNLPGFVVKAVDEQQDYLFEFIKSEKTTTNYWLSKSNKGAMEVTAKQMKKVRDTHSNKTFEQLMNERGGGMMKIKMVDDKGRDVTEDLSKKKIGKEINAIEL